MLITDQVVEEFAEGVVTGIRNNIMTKSRGSFGPPNTTGHAADSLFWTWDGRKLIIGSHWEFIMVLEDGRKPGKMPPREAVEGWVDKKPIEGGISKDSLAFLIQRSIGKYGTLLYRDGGHSGVISDFINDDYIQENLTDKLRDNIILSLTSSLLNQAV